MHRLSALVALALASSIASAQDPADLHHVLDAVREKHQAPGLAGAIIRDGNLLAVGVCGVRSLGGDAQGLVTLDDRWPTGSCTKPMTRFMLARLAERQHLDPSATLAALLPNTDMREEYKSQPLTNVLSHRAGIQPYTEIGPRLTPIIFELKGTPAEQRAAFAAHVLGEEPAAPPGTTFIYSNAGYCIASVAAESKTGEPWETLVHDQVLVPLAMSGSVAGPDPDAAGQPRGHIRGPSGFRPVRPMGNLAVMTPAGGVKATPADFARFAAAYADFQAGREVGGISSQTAARFVEAAPVDLGGDAMTPQTFFGGDGQYTAAFAVWPALHLGIAVLSNAGESDELCADAIEAIRATHAPDAPTQRRRAGPGGAPGEPPVAGQGKGPTWGFQIMAMNEDWSVGSVTPGSLAEKLGLKEGDLILAINGKPLADIPPDDRMPLIRADHVTFTLSRDRAEVQVELKR